MEFLSQALPTRQQRLRAIVEIIDGELKIYPIANNEQDERRIMDGLRFFTEAFGEQ